MSPVHAEGDAQNHLSLRGTNGALMSGLVCVCVGLLLTAAGPLDLCGDLCLWEPRHGWLMNGSVSISTAIPLSQHRDIHGLLQVSQKSAKTFCEPRSGELCGLFCAVGEGCGAERKPSGLCEPCTKATVGRCFHVYRAEKVQQRIVATQLPILEIEMCVKNRTAKSSPYLVLPECALK